MYPPWSFGRELCAAPHRGDPRHEHTRALLPLPLPGNTSQTGAQNQVSQSPGPGPPGGLPCLDPSSRLSGANTNTSLIANHPAPWTSRSPPPPREGPPLSSPLGAPTPANSSPGPAGTRTQQEIGQYFGSIVQKDRFCYIVQNRKLSYEQGPPQPPTNPLSTEVAAHCPFSNRQKET